MIRAAVAGASGYAGGEILRLLLAHPEFEVGAVTAGSSAGERLGTIHRNLTPLADRVLTDTTVATLAGHDVVFLALPHGHSAALAAQLPDEVVIIDCGADFRLESQEAWTAFYDTPYAGSWPYGMPELSVGGGAISLALAPGLAAGVLDPRDIVIVAASGSSGAGKSLKAHLLGAEVMGSMSPYGVGGGHRHTPEIEQNLSRAAGRPVTISFTPTLAPMPRGILATCTARLAEGGDPAVVRSVWESAYAHEPFVHLLPEGDWPRTADVLGSNNVHLGLIVDTHAGRVVVVSAVDNLTKGTAGAAVQCANLALGFEETLGLPQTGVAP